MRSVAFLCPPSAEGRGRWAGVALGAGSEGVAAASGVGAGPNLRLVDSPNLAGYGTTYLVFRAPWGR